MDPGFSKDHKFSMDRKFAAYCPCRSSSCVMIVNFCCPDHVHHVQEAEDSSKQAEHNTSQASKQPSKEAAAEGAPLVSKDTEMEDAELASKGVEDNDGKHVGGGSKGTKRAAEHEAGAENSAASLTVAPSAKRQKTDADWGELVVIQSLLAVLATCALSCNAARLVHGSPHREASYPSPSGFSCLNAKSPPLPLPLPSPPVPSPSLALVLSSRCMQASPPQKGQGTHSCWPAASLTASVLATWKLMTWRKSPSWSLMASPVSNSDSAKLVWITLAASQMVC